VIGFPTVTEDWPWSNYLAFIGNAEVKEWLTPDWVSSQFGINRAFAIENYRRFVLGGVGQEIDVWSGLNGQIFLGNEAFVSKMQNKVENDVSDYSIPKKTKASDRDASVTDRREASG